MVSIKLIMVLTVKEKCIYSNTYTYYFPKRPSGAPLHTLSKLYDVPVGFVTT